MILDVAPYELMIKQPYELKLTVDILYQYVHTGCHGCVTRRETAVHSLLCQQHLSTETNDE